jgi:hypothetical protein
MKTSSLLLLCFVPILGCANVLAQGTVVFDNRITGTVVTHVYLPSPANPGLVQIGNGVSDYPQGTTDWTGWTLISGSGFSAQLFAAPGANAAIDSLAPAFPVTTFRTGAAAGFLAGVIATLTGVPVNAPVATVQMRVWDNKGGLITDWASALAQPPGTEILGVFRPLNVLSIGSPTSQGPVLLGLQSFNLTYNVPEPSAFVLAGFGALLLWVAHRIAHRRRLELMGLLRVHRPGLLRRVFLFGLGDTSNVTGENPDDKSGMDAYVAKVRY